MPAPSASSSRRCPRRRRQGHAARVPAEHRPARGPRGRPRRRAELHQARDHRHDQRPLRRQVGHGRRQGRLPRRRARGQGCRGAAGRDDAGRDRAGGQHREHRARDDEGRDRPRVIKVDGRMRTREPHVYAIGDIVGGLWLAHTAGTRAYGRAHHRGRRRRARHGLQRPAARDVLPARGRLDRADRAAAASRASTSRSARSRSRRSPRR